MEVVSCAFLISFLLNVNHIGDYGAENDEARHHVHIEVLESHAARSEDHVERNKELEQGHKKP